jgi:hypothetical protein
MRLETRSEEEARHSVEQVGPLSPSDTREERSRKINALRALREAAIANGLELWSPERTRSEMQALRRSMGSSD